jgi:ribosome-binding protein aMBF1 (putative translation factor)
MSTNTTRRKAASAPLVSREVMKASERLRRETKEAIAADPVLSVEMKAAREEAEIAIRLAKARKDCGLTQADLAARMGRTQSQIARMERKGYLGSIRSLARFAAACGKKLTVRLE